MWFVAVFLLLLFIQRQQFDCSHAQHNNNWSPFQPKGFGGFFKWRWRLHENGLTITLTLVHKLGILIPTTHSMIWQDKNKWWHHESCECCQLLAVKLIVDNVFSVVWKHTNQVKIINTHQLVWSARGKLCQLI